MTFIEGNKSAIKIYKKWLISLFLAYIFMSNNFFVVHFYMFNIFIHMF